MELYSERSTLIDENSCPVHVPQLSSEWVFVICHNRPISQILQCICPISLPRYTIRIRNVHISVLNGIFWDNGQVHCGVCQAGLLECLLHIPSVYPGSNPKIHDEIMTLSVLLVFCERNYRWRWFPWQRAHYAEFWCLISHWGHWWRRLQPTSSIITDAKSLASNLDYFAR